jgi:hypothetical protein
MKKAKAIKKFLKKIRILKNSVYNPNRLEWHLGDENVVRTPQVSVWSCPIASESFDYVFKRLAVALAKSQDHRASCGVFSFGNRPSDSRYVTGPAWAAKSRNTVIRTHPLHCRTALIERLLKDWVQRWNKAQSLSESIRQAHLVLRL